MSTLASSHLLNDDYIVRAKDGEAFYRGGNSIEARKGVDYKVDKDGFVNEKGPSLNTNKNNEWVDKKGGAFEVDLNTIPEGLKLKNTKGSHYEIVPSRKMTEAEYLDKLSRIKLKTSNKL